MKQNDIFLSISNSRRNEKTQKTHDNNKKKKHLKERSMFDVVYIQNRLI